MRKPKFGDVYEWSPGSMIASKLVMYIGPDLSLDGVTGNMWTGASLTEPEYRMDGWNSSGVNTPDNGSARWVLKS